MGILFVVNMIMEIQDQNKDLHTCIFIHKWMIAMHQLQSLMAVHIVSFCNAA